MKIERVDEKTVKCYLTNEELNEYQITYKDFILRSDRAREVMEEIMGQAEEEVGYQPPKFAFDLQIMMLPDKGMILTFSEKEPDGVKAGESFLECLKDIKSVKDMLTGATPGSPEANDKEALALLEAGEEGDGAGQEIRPDRGVFAFDGMKDLLRYAALIPENQDMGSSLYVCDDHFLLLLERGEATDRFFSHACIRALEFGNLSTAQPQRISWLKEHSRCLIEESALPKLRQVGNEYSSKG